MRDEMKIKCSLYEYKCAICGSVYKSPVYIGGYGQFLLRNYGSDEFAWLNATSDSVFNEVSKLVRKNPRIMNLKQRAQSDIFQKIIGYVYDPDKCGNYYGIGVDPECPSCKEHHISGYKELSPPEYVELDVFEVTSCEWEKLTLKEKEKKLDVIICTRS